MSQAAQARFDALAPNTAASFVTKVDKANKSAVESSIAKALSVDFATIIDGTDVGAVLDQALVENVNLIKSISTEHFGKVSKAVLDNYRGIPQPEGVSLTQRLQDIGGITKKRAKFIARDQTSKLTGDLNQSRQQDNGIDEYIWRTAKDRRVVGTPGGLYPKGTKGHGNHYEREGKTFRWDSPPSDGHCGQAYGCRCYAEPKLNLEKLKAQYI
ncbi:Phage Mu protein F like protein [compost metagenome]